MDTPSDHARASAHPAEHESGPRLVLRFALYTGVVLLCAGVAIAWLVDREVANRAEKTLEAQARTIAEQNLRGHLRASDFTAPVSPARRRTLDGLFRNSVVIPGGVGGRLVNPRGTITYAARHQLINTAVTYPRVIAAVLGSGRASRRVAHMNTWSGQKDLKVLRILVPVRPTPTSRPIGVLELDQDYRSVDISVGNARLRLAVILALALLALYMALFPILRRVTRQLKAHNERLRELAEERGRLFEAERAARTEAEEVQRLLAEQNERLRELDRLKDEFVSLVSHELRTPLTSIRGYVELMLDDRYGLSADQRRFLEIVDRNSARLLELVADLLFLAQIDAGKLVIEVDTVDLNQIVEECVETSSPAADVRGIRLGAHLDPVPEIQGDRARLAQVLDNLVSNAVKFTPRGGRVDVRLRTDRDAVVLEVKDTGLGIPADEQAQLFDRFFRSSTATQNAIPGTGLGLTITKAIVERHGGLIAVDSAENVGTTVRVRLPLRSEQKLAA
ncbi:MAG TPA: HAMP domain-containing sensor histidine kinase [Gaiellaceae bacterium]|nr:HAMP domain-containing sensor histidine kinase [Gaiellaceae bacterium]